VMNLAAWGCHVVCRSYADYRTAGAIAQDRLCGGCLAGHKKGARLSGRLAYTA